MHIHGPSTLYPTQGPSILHQGTCAYALAQGGPKIALRGGDGMGAWRRRGGGVPEMGFHAGPFVLCKGGCCHQRRRNTNFGPEKKFSLKNFPPHMCSQNDQRDVGIILSHVCWGRTPPPPPTARQVGQPQPKPPSRHGDQGGGGGGLGKWASVPSPPRKAIFFPPSTLHQGTHEPSTLHQGTCASRHVHLRFNAAYCTRAPVHKSDPSIRACMQMHEPSRLHQGTCAYGIMRMHTCPDATVVLCPHIGRHRTTRAGRTHTTHFPLLFSRHLPPATAGCIASWPPAPQRALHTCSTGCAIQARVQGSPPLAWPPAPVSRPERRSPPSQRGLLEPAWVPCCIWQQDATLRCVSGRDGATGVVAHPSSYRVSFPAHARWVPFPSGGAALPPEL